MTLKDTLARAEADIQKFGWHIVLIHGKNSDLGFCFTIGLAESYGHPEILLFAAGADPSGIASFLSPIVEQIAAGKTFADGRKVPQAFNQHTGVFRNVLDLYRPYYVGTAAAYYQGKSFEMLQLFWPDGDGFFPWQSEFSENMPIQPCLFQDNLILAGLDLETAASLLAQEDPSLVQKSLAELMIDPTSFASEDIMEGWEDMLVKTLPRSLFSFLRAASKNWGTVAQITIMGDPLILRPNGTIEHLDTGRGTLTLLAKDQKGLPMALIRNATELFTPRVILHAFHLDYKPAPGEVYSWRQDPHWAGGSLHVNNLDHVSAKVHLYFKANAFKERHAP